MTLTRTTNLAGTAEIVDHFVAIITWIERTYHGRRRQRALGKLTPIEFEAIIGYSPLTAAA